MTIKPTNSTHLRHQHHHQYADEFTIQNPLSNISSLLLANDDEDAYKETQIKLHPNNISLVQLGIYSNGGDSEDKYKFYVNGLDDNAMMSNNSFNLTADTNYTEPTKTIYSVAIPPMVFLCALAALVNIIIACSAFWCRKPMSPTLYFSISLALADAYTSIVLGVGLVINSLFPILDIWKPPACLSLTMEALRLGGILVTVSHLLALAINHWIGIVRPLHYAATMTRRTAWIVIILSWICPILLIFIYFSSGSGQGFQSDHCGNCMFLNKIAFRGLFASFFFSPLVVMSLIYIHIFLIVKRHQVHRLRYQVNEQSTQQLRRNVKAVVTTVLILGTYVIGWMPATMLFIIVCDDCTFTRDQFSNTPVVVKYGIGIGVNSFVILKVLIDPIIYAARMADIQFALKKMKYDILSRCFGACLPSLMASDALERGYSRHERSMNDTKSLRMSSFGSASSTRRPFLNSTNMSPTVSARQANLNHLNRQACKSLNGHTRQNKSNAMAEMDL